MKKFLISAMVLLVATASIISCKKIITAVFKGTDVNIPPVEMTLPILLAISPTEQNFGSYTQHINLDSSIRAKTAGLFGINAVSTIKLKEITLNLTNADALNNLSNFESARLTLTGSSNNVPAELFNIGFPDQYLATYTFAPANPVELLSYLKGSTVTYTVYGKNRRITSKPLQLQVLVTLRAN